MLLKIFENKRLTEPNVTVEYAERTPQVEQVIGYIQYLSRTGSGIPVTFEGEFLAVDPSDVLYIESVDRKTFLYTAAKVYETPRKLYELEGGYSEYMRISKSCIINLQRIRSIRPDFGAKLLATMESGEKIYVSRQYAADLKARLGLGGKQK